MINKITYPLNSLERLQKYIKKGYHACNGTLFTLSKSINEMDSKIFNPQENATSDELFENSLKFYADGSPRFFGVD